MAQRVSRVMRLWVYFGLAFKRRISVWMRIRQKGVKSPTHIVLI